MVSFVKMDTTAAWDDCGSFIGKAQLCAPS